jgi:hypothetical protein
MPTSWKLYRVLCFFQTAAAAFVILTSIFSFFQSPSFSDVARALLFILVLMLSIFAINTVNNNYPDKPIDGNQKTVYNRLFMLNFVFLAFLFGFVFAEYRVVNRFAKLIDQPVLSLPFELIISLITYVLTLIFQLVILYGLYQLRVVLYENFRKRKFDFEETTPA